MNIIVLVVDRLHTGFLGCYGNAWVATPHFNRLAAEGFVFDQAFVDHPDLAELCRSWWTGTHYLQRESRAEAPPMLVERFSESGFTTTCLTDEPAVAGHPLAARFDEVVRIGHAAGDDPLAASGDTMAESVEQTQLAQFFAAAMQALEQPREPFLLWLHSRGMGGAWNAPFEFRRQYADEEEAEPPRIVVPPCRYLGETDDPDELWGLCQAYAAQVSLVDECLGGLLEMLEEQLVSDTALVVLGARGFPLGRNRRLGGVDQALYGELVQTAWLVRLPDAAGAMARSEALVQPGDLMPTLLELSRLSDSAPAPDHSPRSLLPVIRDDLTWRRDRICLANESGERACRTPAWYLRLPAPRPTLDEGPSPELFGKPDDRWEVNDVAQRCPEIVAAMRAAHDELARSLAAREGELPALDELLASDLR
ncbi:MAG TPA: sulfatase-like hydrolase/transferase [Pirellulales bacterium]|jgi:arylsulfatase A-like enzyme|nr:sulfatase-like hydrolase/transferase [Pirellulales bacterium]